MDYKIIDESTTEGKQLPLSGEAVQYLVKSRNWTMFIAIIGFICLGLLLVAAIYILIRFGAMQGRMGGALPFRMGILAAVYFLLALIYFFPMLYLLKFSQHSEKAVRSLDPSQLTQAIKNLSQHFKWVGISILCIIGLYVIGIAVAIIINVAS